MFEVSKDGLWRTGFNIPVVEQRHKDAAAWALDKVPDSLTWQRAMAAHVSPGRVWEFRRAAEAMARMERAAIATLQAERDRYRVALEPFAAVADYYDDDSEPDDFSILADLGTLHTMKVSKLGYYRAARTALSDTPAVQS